MVVVMSMAVPGQLQEHERHSRGDQHGADDRVLGALDRRAELEAHGDDHATQDDRYDHVGHPGQA
jgi:hypothetical protein